MDASERRDFSRVPVEFAVTIDAGEGRIINSDASKDVSMRGLFVVTHDRLPSGEACRVTIHLDAPGGNHHIAVSGHVRRATAEGFAVEFSEIPIEDYEHLRNLVLYNADQADRIEEELDEHLGLKCRSTATTDVVGASE